MPKVALFLLAVTLAYSTPTIAAKISKADAIAIVLREAGCREPEDCDVRGGLEKGNWIFTVWFVTGREADGSPKFTPGAWLGLTLNANGKVIDRMPGL